MTEKLQKLQKLYSEIADLTFEDCKKKCRNLGSCCESFYCEVAMQVAKDEYGLELKPTGNKIPLLDSDGKCIAPPHVRQMCSFHSCDINSAGYFKGDKPRTERYFQLRDEIETIEMARFDEPESSRSNF